MADNMYSRILTSAALAAICAFGFYGALGAASYNGLFSAITQTTLFPPSCPGGPEPFRTTYTGWAPLDQQFAFVVCFFSIGLQGPQTADVSWATGYLTLHFFAGWLLLCLEGLRRGNRGRLVSWTGTLGLAFQRLSYTLCVPLYLILHLLTSAHDDPTGLAVAAEDVVALPWAATMAFLVPMLLMALPSPSLLPPSVHYGWNAVWQVFPVLQTLYHYLLKEILVRAPIGRPHVKTDHLYRFVLTITVVSQSALLAVALLLSTTTTTALLFQGTVDLPRVLIPYWPWNSPVLDEAIWRGTGTGLPALVQLFLQWDIYSGGLALLVWAVHSYHVTGEPSFLWNVVPKVAFWTALGGPVGAATVLLWERDAILLQRMAVPKEKEK